MTNPTSKDVIATVRADYLRAAAAGAGSMRLNLFEVRALLDSATHETRAPRDVFSRFPLGTLFQLKESGNLAVLTPDGQQDIVLLKERPGRLFELARAVYDESFPESCELLRLITEMHDSSADETTCKHGVLQRADVLPCNDCENDRREIHALFNTGIGVLKDTRFSFSFSSDIEAAAAFRYITQLGGLETGSGPEVALKIGAVKSSGEVKP